VSPNKSAFNQILKSTSILGGVQIMNIIVLVIRSKFIAILLGPIGIGISGMLTATIGIISGMTNFGLGTSAIRDISVAFEKGNSNRISIITQVLNRWVWVTGLIGMILVILFSPLLSFWSFGNYDYTIAFIFLSITVLMGQLNVGNLVLLQGSRKIKLLANANLLGSLIGLFTTIPLFYFLGINGIVPSILIASFISLTISHSYKQKINIPKIRVSNIRAIAEGKKMLKMGFLISMSGFVTLAVAYFVRLFISSDGSISDVGLFNAGFAIINTYVGIIFTAMGSEYFPRLASVVDDFSKSNKIINSQIEFALIILGPIIVLFILSVHWVIQILYSDQFLSINIMLIWAAVGMLFKAVSWAIGFVLLTNGSGKLFFYNELFTNVYITIFSICGYSYWGLNGLGYAFLASYILYFFQILLVSHFKFKFLIQLDSIIILMIHLVFAMLSTVAYFNFNGTNYIFACIIIGAGSLLYSFGLLRNRMDLSGSFLKLIRKI
jgi:O-antigen/teichoic acid export membrane protein